MRALAERTVREATYVLVDLLVGVVGFSVIVTGIAAGVSLAITLVGVPIVAATLLLARRAAILERARARMLLGVSLAAPTAVAGHSSTTARLIAPLRDRAAWRASAYFLLMLPVGALTFSLAVTWVGSALLLVTLPAWAWALPHGGPEIGSASWWSTPWELAASSVIGLVLLAVAPIVIHTITRADRVLLPLLGDSAPSAQQAV
jgi:hypothetical protein